MTDSISTDLQLLNCPFCGCAGHIPEYGDNRGYYATCASAECYVSVGENYDRDATPDHMFPTKEEAAAAWNRRVS